MAPILGYWDLRGLITPIRLVLAYADERYEYKEYTFANTDEWFKKDKPELQNTLDFPNLPYFIDGSVQITQSKVIFAYLGRKYKLEAETDAEKIRAGLALEFLEDMHSSLCKMAYLPACISNRDEVHETLRKDYEAGLEGKLAAFSKFLGANNWIAGERLTNTDFFVWDVLDWHRVLFQLKYINANENICNYLKRVEELKGVKEFLASDKYSPLPLYGPSAVFGHTKDWKRKD